MTTGLTSSGTWSPMAAFTLGSCTSTQSQWPSELAALHERQSEHQDLEVRSGTHHVKCCSAVVQLAATVVGHHNACSPCIHCQPRVLRGHHALHQQEASVEFWSMLGFPAAGAAAVHRREAVGRTLTKTGKSVTVLIQLKKFQVRLSSMLVLQQVSQAFAASTPAASPKGVCPEHTTAAGGQASGLQHTAHTGLGWAQPSQPHLKSCAGAEALLLLWSCVCTALARSTRLLYSRSSLRASELLSSASRLPVLGESTVTMMALYPAFSAPAGVQSVSETLLFRHGRGTHCVPVQGILCQPLQACWHPTISAWAW